MAMDTVEMTLSFTHTLTLKPNTGQHNNSPAEPRETKLETESTDGSIPNHWLTCVWNYHFVSPRHTWIRLWVFGCLLQCGCLDSPARDRVYKDGARHFCVRSLSACVKDAEGWRFGPWVGEVGRMRLGSQSLWCYCWQRRESLRMGPAKGQHQLPPPNMRMTTLWATQVLLLLSHDTSCVLAYIHTTGKWWRNDLGLFSTLDQTSWLKCTETGYRFQIYRLQAKQSMCCI